MSASELAETIGARRASSEEVIEAHLRRIEDVNPTINAVVIVLGDEAVEAAKSADRAVAAGGELPRLHGVPFTVKGNIDVAGTPTTQGLKALIDAYPSRDAPHVARLRAAGAIPIGRTNLATFGIRWHTDSELWGETVKSLGPVAHAWRVQRRRRRCAGDRHDAAGGRRRCAWLAALAGSVLRHRRAAADARSHPTRLQHRAGGHADQRPADDGRGSNGPQRGRPARRA